MKLPTFSSELVKRRMGLGCTYPLFMVAVVTRMGSGGTYSLRTLGPSESGLNTSARID